MEVSRPGLAFRIFQGEVEANILVLQRFTIFTQLSLSYVVQP
jgi:hypothetical protein